MAAVRRIKGSARDYYKQFKFVIEIDDLPACGFQGCSEFESEIEEVASRHGGALVAQKDFGLVNFTDLTLTKGGSKERKLYEWHLRIMAIASEGEDPGDEEKKTLDIVQQSRAGNPLERVRCYKAWPSKYKLGPWDNNASENVQEETVIKFEWGERIPA